MPSTAPATVIDSGTSSSTPAARGSDPDALADPDAVAFVPQEQVPVSEESPYILFGERIVVREFDDSPTFITKPYTLPVGKAQKVNELLPVADKAPLVAATRTKAKRDRTDRNAPGWVPPPHT